MKAIGGYLELELNQSGEYHSDAIRLNSGRNALKYLLKANSYSKIYMPYYTCDVLMLALHDIDIVAEYYYINENFEPVFDFDNVKASEVFLYTNYFGLKDQYIAELTQICNRLIIDNAQAFFSAPVPGIDTFYSPRKFFGVPDGAYLYSKNKLINKLETDESFGRMQHLLKRIDQTAEAGYKDYLENERSLTDRPLKNMATLTQKLLGTIDYEKAAKVRRRNFQFLNKQLGHINPLKLTKDGRSIPLVYPFYAEKLGLRERLVEHQIYTGQYWREVALKMPVDSVEYKFSVNIIHLPVDQRYNENGLKVVVDHLISCL